MNDEREVMESREEDNQNRDGWYANEEYDQSTVELFHRTPPYLRFRPVYASTASKRSSAAQSGHSFLLK